MRTTRLAVAGLALAAAVGLTGCGPSKVNDTGTGNNPAAAPATTKPADPRAELAAAATKLTTESMKVEISSKGKAGMTGSGKVDAKGDQMEMSMTIAPEGVSEKIAMETRKIGTDIYLKFGGSMGALMGANKGKWMHIDSTKMKAGSAFSMESNDPKNVSKLINSASDVKKTGDNTFTGTIDPSKSPNGGADIAKSFGNLVKPMPFTAKTDAEGRLIEMTVDMNAITAGMGSMTTKYTDFGTAVTVEKPPAGEVAEMPKEMLGAVGA